MWTGCLNDSAAGPDVLRHCSIQIALVSETTVCMIRTSISLAACAGMLLAGFASASAGALDHRVATTVPLETTTRSNGFSMPAPSFSKSPYSPIISQYAKTYGVPVDLAHAVVRVESNFNPKARGRAGEIGLMQIKPATARMMGYSGASKGLYDPETNIKYGMKYLAAAHKLGGGKTCNTILKYNAGHGAKRMNPVSANYCGKVKSLIE